MMQKEYDVALRHGNQVGIVAIEAMQSGQPSGYHEAREFCLDAANILRVVSENTEGKSSILASIASKAHEGIWHSTPPVRTADMDARVTGTRGAPANDKI
jgi:hypothetical protein